MCLYCAVTGDHDVDMVDVVRHGAVQELLTGKRMLSEHMRSALLRMFALAEESRPCMNEILSTLPWSH